MKKRETLYQHQGNRPKGAIFSILVAATLFTGCNRDLSTLEEADTSARSVVPASNSIIEASFFEKNKSLGGDATIKNAELKSSKTSVEKVFTVEVTEDNVYYLSAWVNSPALDEQKSRFMLMQMAVNNKIQAMPFGVTKAGWHSGPYSDATNNKIGLKLNRGINTITFSCQAPLTPSVDFVRLTRDWNSSDISVEAYTKFINEIKTAEGKNKPAPSSVSDTASSNVAALMMSTASTATTMSLYPDDPLYNYKYVSNGFNYSFYTTVYLTSGKNMSFTSWAGSLLHVLEVFSADNPQSQSWSASSTVVSGSQRGYVAFTAPATGYYYVKLRSYYGMESGTASVTVYAGSGSTPSYYYDCPVAGLFSIGHSHYNGEELNYFTSHNTGDPRIWVVDNNGFPGKVAAYNDDYGSHGGDFYWGVNSRVKKNLGRSMQGIIVTAYSSYIPTGFADLYSGCKNSSIAGSAAFPNLKADDAIMSAPATLPGSTPYYNCFAWAGGFTSFWMEGTTPEHSYGAGWIWSTWDDYYGNNPERYIGAMTYTPVGADADNAVVAMWALPSGWITHGSVRKPGNYHAHGYDWESKPGEGPRTFHPRDALSGPVYGNIVKYYRIDDGSSFAAKQDVMFEESVAKGLTVVESVELNNSEKSLIASRRNELKNGTQKMNYLFNNWLNSIRTGEYKLTSSAYQFIDTKDGQELLQYSKTNLKEAILFFAPIIFNTDKSKAFEQNVSYYMFWEAAKDKYGHIMENLKAEWKKDKYTKDRKYIAPLPETFTKKYIKVILAQM